MSRPIPSGTAKAFLFDMDGTILSSIPAVTRAWDAWAARVGVDPVALHDYLHGRPAVETITRFAPPGADIATEVAWIEAAELADTDGITPIPGAQALLSRLPRNRWAVVTSATRRLALMRIAAAGLPLPDVLIASDDVTRGKPDPEGYRKGAAALGLDARDCVVFEDAPAGIAAGQAAGARVIQIPGLLPPQPGLTAIADYDALAVTILPDGLAFSVT